ncbi:MAG TPA: PIG-L family deacetylase, partial [Verrucomicrobiae bacterium]|nr:PIG-L family deacetylase [Verrucomicrobiae bacterium]
MKPILTSPLEFAPLLAFGAHPDDIEFGCGGVIAAETRAGRPAHFIVCSRGEAGSYGTSEIRTAETENAAKVLGAAAEFLELDGDAHLEIRAAHAIQIAAALRRIRPGIVLAPSIVENQHPDHWRLGKLVRDAARIARSGKIRELAGAPPHK